MPLHAKAAVAADPTEAAPARPAVAAPALKVRVGSVPGAPAPAPRLDAGEAGNGPVDPLRDPLWDARLENCPGATCFHRAAWARVLQATYGYTPAYFVRGAGPTLTLLPMMEVKSWLTGRRGVSLPFTDQCEPIVASADSGRQLVRVAAAYGRERSWRCLDFHGGQELFDAARPAVGFHGHQLDLPGDPLLVFCRFDQATRRNVRRGQASGLELSFEATPEAMRDFYDLVGRTRRRQGLPPQPFAFFHHLHHHLLAAGQGCLVLARWRGTPVAGAIFLHSGRTTLYKFGASNEAFQHLRANNLVMWEAMKWHIERGFTGLDFGRTSFANEGLRRFKLGWGARERTLHYFKFDLRRGEFVTTADRASGWHTRAFRLLPSFCSRWVGAALYRHVA